MDNYTGKRLDGRYEIQEVIGVGGMAVVYKAYDNVDDRIVAVKILKDEFLANEEFRRRFKNESKAISLLSHPNIVKVYNVNYGDRLQYIVMEYVEGITLKEYIEQQGHLGVKETVHFTMQILRALQHAHDKGIIHRDIKPQNILLLSNGTIKVTDFGIARFSYSDTKTMTDSAIGSVHYISPEQARGLPIDERTDIYSIGVAMYEMLTGRVPFVSDNSVSVALMQLQNDPRSIREINPNIPVGLEQIVMRAMEKDTKSRYQTASEMLLDIEEFKRNPGMRFQQQKYFVDNEPTRLSPAVGSGAYSKQPAVSSPTVVVPAVPAAPAAAAPAVPKVPKKQPKPEQDDDYDYEEANKGKIGFVIAGVLIGLIVVGVIAFTGLYFFAPEMLEKLPISSFASSSRVPQLVGLNYSNDIKDNEKYNKYKIVVEYENTKNQDEIGVILRQEPEDGKKFEGNKKEIKIFVGAQKVVIPDVVNMNWSSAEDMLKNMGLVVNKIEEPNLSVEFGTVTRTNPPEGTEVDRGSTVHIYYATDSSYKEVPYLVGMDVNIAKQRVESLDLKLEEPYEEEDSDKPKGEIIAQAETKGTKVPPGTKIHVTVSTGIAPENKVTLSIVLPSLGKEEYCVIYVDGESKFRQSILMDGSSHKFEIEGEGDEASVKVHIDGDEYYTCTVDFAEEEPVISNQKYTSTGSAARPVSLTSVVGQGAVTAKESLVSKGIRSENIIINYVAVEDPAMDGKVIMMNPAPSSSVVYNENTKITLTVGQFEGV